MRWKTHCNTLSVTIHCLTLTWTLLVRTQVLSSVEMVFSVVFQREMETRHSVVKFENRHFGEVHRQKSARKTIGYTRYCLQISTKPNLCLQVQFSIFSGVSLNFSEDLEGMFLT